MELHSQDEIPVSPDFSHARNQGAKPVSIKDVNRAALPQSYAFENELYCEFLENGEDVTCATVLPRLMKHHFEAYKKGNSKIQNKFDYMATGKMANQDSMAYRMLLDIQKNGVAIGVVRDSHRLVFDPDDKKKGDRFVPPAISVDVPAMNQKHVFMVVAGEEYVKRVAARVATGRAGNKLQNI